MKVTRIPEFGENENLTIDSTKIQQVDELLLKIVSLISIMEDKTLIQNFSLDARRFRITQTLSIARAITSSTATKTKVRRRTSAVIIEFDPHQ